MFYYPVGKDLRRIYILCEENLNRGIGIILRFEKVQNGIKSGGKIIKETSAREACADFCLLL